MSRVANATVFAVLVSTLPVTACAQQDTPAMKKRKARLKRLFNQLDQNGDRALSMREFLQLCKGHHGGTLRSSLTKQFELKDRTSEGREKGNGMLTRAEFTQKVGSKDINGAVIFPGTQQLIVDVDSTSDSFEVTILAAEPTATVDDYVYYVRIYNTKASAEADKDKNPSTLQGAVEINTDIGSMYRTGWITSASFETITKADIESKTRYLMVWEAPATHSMTGGMTPTITVDWSDSKHTVIAFVPHKSNLFSSMSP